MKLLESFKIKNLELKNRIVMPPMDTYISKDGFANNYHLIHYGARALADVGLIIQEATAVRADGRISEQDLGIWDDKFIPNLKNIVDTVHSFNTKIGIQLNDAGRKGNVKNATIFAPSSISFSENYVIPKEMTIQDINELKLNFKSAVIRAKKIGYDLIEIHAAHGYLLSEFISEFVNKRADKYGGNIDNRMLLLKEILEIVRENFDGIVSVRVSSDDWIKNGMKPEIMGNALNKFRDLFDIINVSSGGVINDGNIELRPGYQIRHTKIIKDIINKPVIAVGLIDTFDIAEMAINDMNIDLIAVGRPLLRNPNWVIEQGLINNIKINDTVINRGYTNNHRFENRNLKR